MKKLIVTADDFGAAVEVNEAVERAHRDGILSAASLMVAGAAANDAVHRLEARIQEKMSRVTAGMQLPPGMKLPF